MNPISRHTSLATRLDDDRLASACTRGPLEESNLFNRKAT